LRRPDVRSKAARGIESCQWRAAKRAPLAPVQLPPGPLLRGVNTTSEAARGVEGEKSQPASKASRSVFAWFNSLPARVCEIFGNTVSEAAEERVLSVKEATRCSESQKCLYSPRNKYRDSLAACNARPRI
jgi:cobalamin biosynthesis protein CobD/CbiB